MSTDRPVPAWRMGGWLIGACNCDWGCPCNFQAPPTYGACEGLYAILVREGRYGDLPLDGVSFVTGGWSPGPIHEGGGTHLLIVDDRATEPQRAAIERLWRGGGVGSPFDEFASVVTVRYEPIVARIDVELDGIRSRVRVGGGDILSLALSRVPNPVTGREEVVVLDHPTGFSSTLVELGMSTEFRLRTEHASFDHGGKYAEFAEISYRGP